MTASTLRLRALLPQDQAFLWDLLHVAPRDPPPAPLRPRGILAHPENPAIALYGKCGFRMAGLRRTYHLMIATP